MVRVAERSGHLEVSGVSRRELEQALDLLPLVHEVQAQAVSADRAELVRALMIRHQIPLDPPASVLQAQRLAAQRSALLATDVFTHESLAQLRGDAKTSSTRTWVTRARKNRKLFTVTFDTRAFLPAFQLTAEGQPRADLAPLLDVLLSAGVEGWELWTWLTTGSGWLSGAVPQDVARTNPQRALRAARRFAADRARAA